MSNDIKSLLARATTSDEDSLRALCRALMRAGYGAPRVRAVCDLRRSSGGPFISDWTADEPKARALAAGLVKDWRNSLRVRLEWEDGRREAVPMLEPPTYTARDIRMRIGGNDVPLSTVYGHIALDDDPDEVIEPGAFNLPTHVPTYRARDIRVEVGGQAIDFASACAFATITPRAMASLRLEDEEGDQ